MSKIIDNDAITGFDGYTNAEATKKKIYTDVLGSGDRAFASGDLLYIDECGFVYFKDRTGDTFRWKGENVSTMEVESAIGKVLQQVDNIVFGVSVPCCDGKAGMAAIASNEDSKQIIWDKFFNNLSLILPPYAIPIFIRLTPHIESTSTHKLVKGKYQAEGFNLKKVKDPLFVADINNKTYVKLDDSIYNNILSGQYRL